jgi:MFS family permease
VDDQRDEPMPRRSDDEPRGRFRRHLIDVTPLRVSRDFRLLFAGMAISDIGNEITFVTIPFQVFAITGSTLALGLLGLCDLVPLLFTPLIGGVVADTVERRRLVLIVNAVLAALSLALAVNAWVGEPRLWVLYLVAALNAGLWGLYSPAVRAWPARLVGTELLPSAFALETAYYNLAALGGPALAGVLIAWIDPGGAYVVDLLTFLAALACLSRMRASPPVDEPETGWAAIKAGMRFLRGKRVVLSTYTIDLNAMVFGMPTALFPAVARRLGVGPAGLGLLYAAPAAGGLVASLLSGGARRVRRQGRAILVAVAVWGLAIAALGLSDVLWVSLVCLAIAGGGDMVSGVFRTAIAQTVVPDELRGRLEGIGLTVWTTGPALGDVEAGVVASLTSVPFSVASGGVLCVLGVLAHAWFAPALRDYDAAVARASAVGQRSPA